MIHIENADPNLIRQMLQSGYNYTQSYNLLSDTHMKPTWKFRSKQKTPIDQLDARACAAAGLHCVREMDRLAELLSHIEDQLACQLGIAKEDVPIQEKDWRALKKKLDEQRKTVPIAAESVKNT